MTKSIFYQIWMLCTLTVVCLASSAQSPHAKMTTHRVTKGETLSSIARQYHVKVAMIEQYNKQISKDHKIKIGMSLAIPTFYAGKDDNTKTIVEQPEGKKTNEVEKLKPTNNKSEALKEHEEAASTIHTVKKGESVYAICKKYGIKVAQLKEANHLDDNLKVKINQHLIIPVRNTAALFTPEKTAPIARPQTTEKSSSESKPYITGKVGMPNDNDRATKPIEVPKAEKQDFKIVVGEKKSDPIETSSVKIPDPMSESKATPTNETTLPPAATEIIRNINVTPNDYSTVFAHYAESSKKRAIYRGIGTFMSSSNPGNQFLALYNYAEMGSVLKVTNLMSKQAIYVKVIGKVPATDAQKDVILKVSSEAADKLKVSEDKFLVEVSGYN